MYAHIIDLVKQIIKSEISELADDFAPLDKNPVSEASQKILPPYLGELGLEVRGFLAMVDPWLRSGWLIPARRPALYPNGKSIHDPVFFKRIDEIKEHYGLKEMVGQLYKEELIRFKEFNYSMDINNITLSISSDSFDNIKNIVKAELSIRNSFIQRYCNEFTAPSIFHFPLTSILIPGYNPEIDFNWMASNALVPSLKPVSYTHPQIITQSHIGLQIRNLPKNPIRNSNINLMISLAKLASDLSGLPILVYGKDDDILPSGYQFSKDLVPDLNNQLDGELSLLSSCKLMIAPDSGWTDLMCWLGIPTLLEQQYFAWGYEALKPFSPKLLISASTNAENEIRIIKLLNSTQYDILLPDPLNAVISDSHLAPHSTMVKNYWTRFNAERL